MLQRASARFGPANSIGRGPNTFLLRDAPKAQYLPTPRTLSISVFRRRDVVSWGHHQNHAGFPCSMTISLLCTRVLQSSAPSRYRPPSVRLCASSSWCLGDLHTQRATAARSLFHQQERRNHHRPHQFPPPPIEEVEQWYHILDLYPGASPEQIKTAHRKLVMKVNTDHDRTRDKTVYTNVSHIHSSDPRPQNLVCNSIQCRSITR